MGYILISNDAYDTLLMWKDTIQEEDWLLSKGRENATNLSKLWSVSAHEK